VGQAFEASVRYSEPVLRRAVRTFMMRRLIKGLGPLGLAALALLLMGEVALIAAGDRSWSIGLFGGVLLFVVLWIAAVWQAHLRNTIGALRRMRAPEASFTLHETDLTIRSDRGAATIPWSAIEEVWELPRCWLFFTAPNQFFTLPTDGLSQEMLAFIRSKVRIGFVAH
jgi:hypothetical protein